MKTLAAFQLRSLGTLPRGARRTITAAVTLVTALGGLGKAFSSVRLPWRKAHTHWRLGEVWGRAVRLSSWSALAMSHQSWPGSFCYPVIPSWDPRRFTFPCTLFWYYRNSTDLFCFQNLFPLIYQPLRALLPEPRQFDKQSFEGVYGFYPIYVICLHFNQGLSETSPLGPESLGFVSSAQENSSVTLWYLSTGKIPIQAEHTLKLLWSKF